MAYFTIHHPKLQAQKKNRNATTLRFFFPFIRVLLCILGGVQVLEHFLQLRRLVRQAGLALGRPAGA